MPKNAEYLEMALQMLTNLYEAHSSEGKIPVIFMSKWVSIVNLFFKQNKTKILMNEDK